MSFNYGAHLSAGFLADENLFLPLTKREKEVSHMEPRYHHTTGERLADAKVVDRKAQKVFVFEDLESVNFIEFMEAFAEKINCEVEFFYDQCSGTNEAILTPRVLKPTIGPDFGKFAVDGFVACKDVAELMPEFEILGRTLRRIGLEIGPPMVGIRWTIM